MRSTTVRPVWIRWVLAPVAAAAVTMGVAGCGGDDNAGGDAPASSSTQATSSQQQSGSTASAQDGGLLSAAETALGKVGSGTVISIDSERQGKVWEVQIITSDGTEHEVLVSSSSGEVVEQPRAEKADAEDTSAVQAATVDYRAAVQKIRDVRSGTITELNLDKYRGTVVWEADVRHNGTKYEVKIDAASGKVLVNKVDQGEDD